MCIRIAYNSVQIKKPAAFEKNSGSIKIRYVLIEVKQRLQGVDYNGIIDTHTNEVVHLTRLDAG
jgi:hypothetical protein